MSAAPAALLEQRRLPQAAALLPAWLERAAQQELSLADFLAGRRDEEPAARAAAETERRLRQAAFPFAATIEQFDFRCRPEPKRQVILRCLDPGFLAQGGSPPLVGPPGPGKTMLAVCIAGKQVRLGADARFITAQQRAAALGRAATSRGRQRLLQPLLRADVLALDELGCLPTDAGFGPALYELVAGRYEQRPTIITSNKSLTDWPQIVQDVALAAAIAGRLLHHGRVFYLKGPSRRTKGRAPAPAAAAEEASDG